MLLFLVRSLLLSSDFNEGLASNNYFKISAYCYILNVGFHIPNIYFAASSIDFSGMRRICSIYLLYSLFWNSLFFINGDKVLVSGKIAEQCIVGKIAE